MLVGHNPTGLGHRTVMGDGVFREWRKDGYMDICNKTGVEWASAPSVPWNCGMSIRHSMEFRRAELVWTGSL